MSTPAKVMSVDALRDLSLAIERFAQEVSVAIGEADADAQRGLDWLRSTAPAHWTRELRKRTDAVNAAKSDLYRKQLANLEDRPSCIEQRQALDKAKRRVDEAHAKIEAVKRCFRAVDREVLLCRTLTQPLRDMVSRDLPLSRERLARSVAALEGYAAITAPSSAAAIEETGSADMTPMRRAEGETPAPDPSAAGPGDIASPTANDRGHAEPTPPSAGEPPARPDGEPAT